MKKTDVEHNEDAVRTSAGAFGGNYSLMCLYEKGESLKINALRY